jgi:hypothetical protein
LTLHLRPAWCAMLCALSVLRHLGIFQRAPKNRRSAFSFCDHGVTPGMAVRKRQAAAPAADRRALKRTSSFESLLEGCRSVWPLKGLKDGLRRLRQSEAPAKALSKGRATGGQGVQLSAARFALGAAFFGLITFLAGEFNYSFIECCNCFGSAAAAASAEGV